MGLLQEGHLEEGTIIERFLGILYIQTFKKEPITEPNRKTITNKTISFIILYSENSVRTWNPFCILLSVF